MTTTIYTHNGIPTANNNTVNAKKEVTIMTTINNFKKHHSNERVIKKMSEREGNATVRQLILRKAYKKGGVSYIKAFLSTTSVQITPLNRAYVAEGGTMQTIIGSKTKVEAGKGSAKVMTIDASAISSDNDLRIKLASCLRRAFYLVTDKDGHEWVVVPVGDDKMRVLNSDGVVVSAKELNMFKADGSLNDNVRMFKCDIEDDMVETAIQSSSQGRKDQLTCYDCTTPADIKFFQKQLDISNSGEFKKVSGIETNYKGLADIDTRVSAKTTAMFLNKEQGCKVYNYAIVVGKPDGDIDGSSLMAAECLAREAGKIGVEGIKYFTFVGEQLQCRPYTAKVAADVQREELLWATISTVTGGDMSRILFINNVTGENNSRKKNSGAKKDVELTLNKYTSNKERRVGILKDYDVVVVINNEETGLDFMGNLDAFKDMYDLNVVDGINGLMFAHIDESTDLNASLNAQMNKIIVRVARECPEAKAPISKAFKAIIDRGIEQTLVFESTPHLFGGEMIDTSYVSGAARMLNPTSVKKHAALFKEALENASKSIELMLNIDKWPVAGHSGMLAPDLAYVVAKTRVLKVTKDYIEAFDPAFEEYFANHPEIRRIGLMLKNPAMGTRECLKIVFVSKAELIERCNKLIADEWKRSLVIEGVEHAKAGKVYLPAQLKAIGDIAAGLDHDGDKGIFYFPAPGFDFVTPVWDNLVMRSVDIGKPEFSSNETFVYGKCHPFVLIMTENLNTGNYKVGIVTNSFRVLSEGLQLDSCDKSGKKWFMDLFRDVFKAGSRGNGKYVSQVKLEENEFGHISHKTHAGIVKDVMRAITKMKLTWENVYAALEDMDVVGRHVQELTIDAQKKFYDVNCEFIEDLKAYTIAPLKFGIIFNLNLDDVEGKAGIRNNKMYSMNDSGKIVTQKSCVVENANGSETHVLSDAFAPFRVYAANKAFEKLNALRAEYITVATDKKAKIAREDDFANVCEIIPAEAQTLIRMTMHHAFTAKKMYGAERDALREASIDKSMAVKDYLKVDAAIKEALNAKFGDMMAALDNELRIIAERYDIAARDMIRFCFGCQEVKGGVVGKLLKAETVAYLAAHSENKIVTRSFKIGGHYDAILGCDAETVVSNGYFGIGITLKDSKAKFTDGYTFATDLMDGKYNASIVDGKLVLCRPITDYVAIPAADESRCVFRMDASVGSSIEDLEVGSNIEIRFEYDGKCKFANVYSEGELIGRAFVGAYSARLGKDSPLFVGGEYYNGVVGTLAGYEVTADGKDNIVVLSNVVRNETIAEAMPEEEKGYDAVTFDAKAAEEFEASMLNF